MALLEGVTGIQIDSHRPVKLCAEKDNLGRVIDPYEQDNEGNAAP